MKVHTSLKDWKLNTTNDKNISFSEQQRKLRTLNDNCAVTRQFNRIKSAAFTVPSENLHSFNEKNLEKHPKHLQKQAFFKSVWPNGWPLRQHFQVHLQM